MYHHIKELMYTVEVGTPDPKFGNMLLEQFGGQMGNSLPLCSIPSKASIAKILSAKIS
jgi:hypothetical protein